MKNPWLARNPLLSMWMSAGNSMLGAARGHLLKNARRQQGATVSEAARAMRAFWSGAALSPRSKKKQRVKSR